MVAVATRTHLRASIFSQTVRLYMSSYKGLIIRTVAARSSSEHVPKSNEHRVFAEPFRTLEARFVVRAGEWAETLTCFV